MTKKITSIKLANSNLHEIPENVFLHGNLRKLNLSNNKITKISSKITALKNLRTLDLSYNKLTQLHAAIFKLPNLRTLIISNNAIKTLPKQIANLSKLKIFIAPNNKITDANLELLPNSLTKLNLTNNYISNVNWIERLTSLQFLWIGGNKLLSNKSLNSILQNLPELKNVYPHDYHLQSDRDILTQHITPLIKPRLIEINNTTKKPVKIFISYCHVDKIWLERLKTHLKVLSNLNIDVDYWDDTKIKAGRVWVKEIEQNLNSATLAILLVSTDFLASEFVMRKEIPQLLEKAEKQGTTIMPLLVAPCMFTDSDISQFQAINSPENVLEDMSKTDQDRIFIKLMHEIKRHI